jgi:hypothetical protein
MVFALLRTAAIVAAIFWLSPARDRAPQSDRAGFAQGALALAEGTPRLDVIAEVIRLLERLSPEERDRLLARLATPAAAGAGTGAAQERPR